MDDIKNKVRPIYSELQGMLSQAPKVDGYMYRDQKELWGRFNYLLKKLQEITEDEEYINLEIKPRLDENELIVTASEYRGKVSGLISRLHGTYFYNEQAPFSGAPAQVISQVQNQHQSTQVVMLLEIQDRISQQIQKFEEGSKERGFLETIKSKLSTVKDAIEFAKLIVITAKDFGLDIDKIKDIL